MHDKRVANAWCAHNERMAGVWQPRNAATPPGAHNNHDSTMTLLHDTKYTMWDYNIAV